MSWSAQPQWGPTPLAVGWQEGLALGSGSAAPVSAWLAQPGLFRSLSEEGGALVPAPARAAPPLGDQPRHEATKRAFFLPKRCASFKGRLVRAVSADQTEGTWRKRKGHEDSDTRGEEPFCLSADDPYRTAPAPLEEDRELDGAEAADPELEEVERKLKHCCVRRARKPTTLISATLPERHVPSYPRVAPTAVAQPVLAQCDSELIPLSCPRNRDSNRSSSQDSALSPLSVRSEGALLQPRGLAACGELRVVSTGTLIDLAHAMPRPTVASPISVSALRRSSSSSSAPRAPRKVFDFSRESVLAEQNMTRAAPVSAILDDNDTEMSSSPIHSRTAGSPTTQASQPAPPLAYQLPHLPLPLNNVCDHSYSAEGVTAPVALPTGLDSMDQGTASPVSAMTPSSCLSVSTASLASVRSFGLPIVRHWSAGGSPIAFSSPAPSHGSSLPTPPPSHLDAYRFQLSPDLAPPCALPSRVLDLQTQPLGSGARPGELAVKEDAAATVHRKERPRIAT